MTGMRLVLIAALAAASLLLGLTVFAASDGGGRGSGQGPDVQLLQEEEQQTPGPTPTLTPQAGNGANQQQEENGDSEEGNGEGEQEHEGTPGGPTRVTVTNPDGKEMQLPCTSDVVRNPDKHPEWTGVPEGAGCEPGRSAPPQPQPNGGERPGQQRGGPQRVSMTNPDGKCVQLPEVANVVRDRQRHPKWSEGCQTNGGGQGEEGGGEGG